MGFWAIFFIIATILAIDTGMQDVTVTVLFAGLAVLFTYLWATKDKRKEDDKKREWKAKEDKARQRFGSKPIVSQVVRDARIRGQGIHAKVYSDRIEANEKTYRYIDYNLAKLDKESDWEQLAFCLGVCFGGGYSVNRIIKTTGGCHPISYTGHVSSDSSVHIYPDVDTTDYIIGYEVDTATPAPAAPPQPTGQKW